MTYRPQRRGGLPARTGARNGSHHQRSKATRLAVSRSTARKPAARGPQALIASLLVLLIGIVTVASAGAIVAGGAAAVTITALDQDLPDVEAFRELEFSQPSRIVDRTGKVQLARVWNERRQVVAYDDIPALVLDATTATEDDTFWENAGIDLEATVAALVSAAVGGGRRGGGSTITQQLVRARLLPEQVVGANDDSSEGLYVRKAMELLQSVKLTQRFPGEDGKEAIITAYLNQASYGAAEGIAAAARLYLGKDLDELTLAEAALLAAIPQEPSSLYPWARDSKGRFAHLVREPGRKGRKGKRSPARYVLRTCRTSDAMCTPSELVARRDYILGRLRDGKGRWTQVSDKQYRSALRERVRIQMPRPSAYRAGWFVDRLLASRELSRILADRVPLADGGYTITTTLDWKAQRLGEKYVQAGAWLPNLPRSAYRKAIRQRNLRRDAYWISRLRGLDLHNGALVAMDYRSGDVLAYVGSAGYDRKKTRRFRPKYDHAGLGRRQMGSAWKPIVYATGIDTGKLTAGSVLLDITTPFAPGWAPKDADSLDRGPVLVREALQYSLNVPAIRALHRTGVKTVRKYAVKAGFDFIPKPLGYGRRALDVAGLAGAIGTVEVSPIDMVAAFGAFGNGGAVTEPRYILRVEDADGKVIYEAGKPVRTEVWSPQTAYVMADILKGNTNPKVNRVWGPIFELRNTRDRSRREMAVKTGTTNDLKDYSTYGFLPIPRDGETPALAVGVWYGNSDSSTPNLSRDLFSMDTAGRTWHAFVRDYTRGWPNARFQPPEGVVAATIDRFTGGAPGAWTKGTQTELFVQGTQPGGRREVDPPGLLYSKACGYGVIQPARAENPRAPASWLAAVDAWASRGGLGRSKWGTRGSTFTLAGKSSFGGRPAPGRRCSGDGGAGRTGLPDRGGGGDEVGGGSRRQDGDQGRGDEPRQGGRGGGGPVPTCRPGTSDTPAGCVIPVR